MLKLVISSGNRIKIYAQLLSHLTNRRQRHPFAQFTSSNQAFDLIRPLSIDRAAIGFVNGDVHSRVSSDTIHRGKISVKMKIVERGAVTFYEADRRGEAPFERLPPGLMLRCQYRQRRRHSERWW